MKPCQIPMREAFALAQEAALYNVHFAHDPAWKWLGVKDGKGRVLGTIAYVAVTPASRTSASIHAWYVRDDVRGLGIGKELLLALEADAALSGYKKLWMTTWYWMLPAALGWIEHTSYPDGAKRLWTPLPR